MRPTENPPRRRRADALLGRVVGGRYRVLQDIASGGMARVYRAALLPQGEPVALKVLNRAELLHDDEEFARRFFLEASTSVKLKHPNTVRVIDYGQDDLDLCYIAMELVRGHTLQRVLREQGALSPARALCIAWQICESLREAHGLGVIHRDLKPSNVLLTRKGGQTDYVKVVDFGLVKNFKDPHGLTRPGRFLGSPTYVSPEQITGGTQDARTDIYSLGVILYRMLSGRVPFDGSTDFATLVAHTKEPPPPLTLSRQPAPQALSHVVERCLAKERSARWRSVDELLAALSAAQASLTLQAKRFTGGARADMPNAAAGDEAATRPYAIGKRPSAGANGEGESPSRTRSRRQHSQLPQPPADGHAANPVLAGNSGESALVPGPGHTQARAETRPWTAPRIAAAVMLVSCLGAWIWWRIEAHDRSAAARSGAKPADASAREAASSPAGSAARRREDAAPRPTRTLLPHALPTESELVQPPAPRPSHQSTLPEQGLGAARASASATFEARRVGQAPTRTAEAAVRVRVRARPRDVQLQLDDEPPVTGSLRRRVARDGRVHWIKVSAPGHEPQEFSFIDEPPPRRVHLRRLPAPRSGKSQR